MCGIVGIVASNAVNQRLYDALTVLQHRGQDAAGIATSGDGELYTRKGSGLVRDVFQQHHMLELKGNAGIGHVRYPTAGCDSASEAQPFYVNAPYGICLGHNGNLTNATELAEILIREDRRHLNTTSDSEVLLNVFASELQRVGTARITPADVFAALNALYRRGRGGDDVGGDAPLRARGGVSRPERAVPPVPRRLCRGRDDHRPRHPRLSGSERH